MARGMAAGVRLVNADQAVVADQVIGGKQEPVPAAKLVTAISDTPMEIIEAKSTEAVPVEGGGSKAK